MNESPGYDAFAGELVAVQRRLYSYILTLVPSLTDADDVLQETNTVLLRKRKQYVPNTEFGAWACRVAYFEVLAYRRRRQRQRARVLFADETLLDHLAAEAAQRYAEDEAVPVARLEHCMGKLSLLHRHLLQLRYRQNQSSDEIAATVGRSPSGPPVVVPHPHPSAGMSAASRAERRAAMSRTRQPERPIDRLLSKLFDAELDGAEQDCLAELLQRDGEARQLYHEQIALHAMLHWVDSEPLRQSSGRSAPVAVAPRTAPILGFLGSAVRGTMSYASQGWPLAYTIATVIVAILLAIGHAIPVSTSVELAGTAPRPEKSRQGAADDCRPHYRALDCQWIADGPTRRRRRFSGNGPANRARCRVVGNHLRHRGQGHLAGAGDV